MLERIPFTEIYTYKDKIDMVEIDPNDTIKIYITGREEACAIFDWNPNIEKAIVEWLKIKLPPREI